jgi:hypothetical protein
VWFLFFAAGAVGLQLAGLPLLRRLPLPPEPELVLAAWFLLAVLVRGAVMRARLRAFERRALRLARRTTDQGRSPIAELGVGVGLGALQAVGGDVAGASFALLAALLRGASRSVSQTTPAPQRERRRAGRRERLLAVACVAGVGLVCAALAWRPLVEARARRAAVQAIRDAGFRP